MFYNFNYIAIFQVCTSNTEVRYEKTNNASTVRNVKPYQIMYLYMAVAKNLAVLLSRIIRDGIYYCNVFFTCRYICLVIWVTRYKILCEASGMKRCIYSHPLEIIFLGGNNETSHKLGKNYISRLCCVERLCGMTMFVQWRY